MRVSIDPTDPAFLDDRPRRVWLNDREVADWYVADEFRRVVIKKDGTVLNGSVLIERLPADKVEEDPAPAPAMPLDAGFSGVLVAEPKPTPAPTPAPSPAPARSKHKAAKRR